MHFAMLAAGCYDAHYRARSRRRNTHAGCMLGSSTPASQITASLEAANDHR